MILSAPGKAQPSIGASPGKGVRMAKGDSAKRIDINRATLQELKSLPGVGEVTARRILEYRKKNPPFRRVEELLIIRGISRSRLEQIRQRICVNCET